MHNRLILPLVFLLILVPVVAVAGHINAFIYHRFDDDRYPSTNISAAIFEQQLQYLRDRQIPALSTREISERIASGRPLPAGGVMLTVDDSYRSFYDVALPLIRKYNVAVSLFVNTDAVGTPGYMNWDEIREAAEAGVEIGNHTASHAYLVEMMEGETPDQWRQRVREDIVKAQDAFDRELGTRPDIFAYPYGEYSPEIIEILKQAGFIAAYAQQSGVIYSGHDPFTLPRFPMGGPYATFSEFTSKAAMRALPVVNQIPDDPIIRDNSRAPQLGLYLPSLGDGSRVFNCFAQAGAKCGVELWPEKGEGWYRVVADRSLTGRRNKYTVTLHAREGWLWFSQLWINADRPVPVAEGAP